MAGFSNQSFCEMMIYSTVLTAVLGGEVPEVQLFEREVDKCGQLASLHTSRLREAFQV